MVASRLFYGEIAKLSEDAGFPVRGLKALSGSSHIWMCHAQHVWIVAVDSTVL